MIYPAAAPRSRFAVDYHQPKFRTPIPPRSSPFFSADPKSALLQPGRPFCVTVSLVSADPSSPFLPHCLLPIHSFCSGQVHFGQSLSTDSSLIPISPHILFSLNFSIQHRIARLISRTPPPYVPTHRLGWILLQTSPSFSQFFLPGFEAADANQHAHSSLLGNPSLIERVSLFPALLLQPEPPFSFLPAHPFSFSSEDPSFCTRSFTYPPPLPSPPTHPRGTLP